MKLKIVVVAMAAVAGIEAQTPPSAPAALKTAYNRIKTNFMKAAEKMPEEHYSFKPVDAVETFGQRVAHIADAQLGMCSALTGERKTGTAKSKSSRTELVTALKASFAACDAAFDALNDANALEVVNGGRGQMPRINALYSLVIHANEVYGAMGVYMRLKGIVPPSSEGR